MVFRTQYKKFKGSYEPSTGPSITDKLVHEEVSDLVKKFLVAGRIPQSGIPADLEVTNKTTMDDIDKAFDEFETAEVANMDKVERCEAMTDALSTIQRLDRLARFKKSQEKAKTAVEEPKKETPKVVEGVSEN